MALSGDAVGRGVEGFGGGGGCKRWRGSGQSGDGGVPGVACSRSHCGDLSYREKH